MPQPAIMLLSPKHIPKLVAIVELFTRYGLRDVAAQQGLLSLAPEEKDLPPEELAGTEALAAAFRRRLVELGPAYVKLGQVLSTRPDLLPAPYIRELESLQDDVGPVAFAEVITTIESELRTRVNKLFGLPVPGPRRTCRPAQGPGARLPAPL